MVRRFMRGARVYAKDGRSYIVDAVEDGVVYCSTVDGTEADFPETALMNEAEWAARSNSRRDQLYTRLKQARAYAPVAAGLDRAAASVMLAKVERLKPGLLDFIAFRVAERIIRENRDDDLLAELSVRKCRAVFEAATPEVRATLLATMLGASVKPLIDAGRLGDNLMRAMLEQGLAAHAADFESFGSRRRS